MSTYPQRTLADSLERLPMQRVGWASLRARLFGCHPERGKGSRMPLTKQVFFKGKRLRFLAPLEMTVKMALSNDSRISAFKRG